MKLGSCYILSTSSSTLFPRKPRLPARSLYRRTRPRLTGKERDAETGLYYYGARYLDPRAGRWLSGDTALGEYIPQARGNNKRLPNGGVYNTVSLHAYNYSNNNPVKYVDPDGETPRSYRTVDVNASTAAGRRIDQYIFVASGSTMDGALDAVFTGIVPFGAGGLALRGINSSHKYRNITSEDGSKLTNALSVSSGILTSAGDVAKILELGGDAGRALIKSHPLASLVTHGLTAYNAISEFSKADDVGMDNMIEKLLGSELKSRTHEGLSALYRYARQEMSALKESGDLRYETNRTGGIIGNPSITAEKLDALKEDLRARRTAIDAWTNF